MQRHFPPRPLIYTSFPECSWSTSASPDTLPSRYFILVLVLVRLASPPAPLLRCLKPAPEQTIPASPAMPRLCIYAGPSPTNLTPLVVNSGVPVKISTDAFEGQIAGFIKGLEDPDTGVVLDTDYFRKRSGVTWSIQVQGAFLLCLRGMCGGEQTRRPLLL